MAVMRVLVAGMGSAIGTNVALRLSMDPQVRALSGFDLEPPRRYIPDAGFHFARPGDARRIHEIVRDFTPDVIVHTWVFEPRARSSPGQARTRTIAGTEALLGAAQQVESVRRIVVRSGVSIYGAGRGRPEAPDVDTAARPTTHFGTILADVEERCAEVADQLGAASVPVRLASIMASNLPNPLGRYLRLPIVAVPFTSKRFGAVHLGDAVRTLAATATSDIDHPINVMAAKPLTALQAVTIGSRVAVPIPPRLFRAGRILGEVPGTPIPEHLAELLARGQVVTPTDVSSLLGVDIKRTTPETVADVYSAGRVIKVDVDRLVQSRGT